MKQFSSGGFSRTAWRTNAGGLQPVHQTDRVDPSLRTPNLSIVSLGGEADLEGVDEGSRQVTGT